MPEPLKPSDYKTGREYRWAKKARAKEQTAPIRALLWLVAIVLIPVWIITGSFLIGIIAGLAAPVLLFGLVVVYQRSKPRA